MYLLRSQIAQLYENLQRNVHPLSPPVLILTALNVDALCATRIFTALLKRDYIPHKVQPVSGYAELQKAGQELVLPLTRQRGGEGGVVICLGTGGLVDLEEILGLDGATEDGSPAEDMQNHGVEVWVIDSHRPWNLNNVFGMGSNFVQDPSADDRPRRRGVDQGCLQPSYRPGHGGVVVWDDGSIEQELLAEREAYMALKDMPEITEEDVGNDSEDDATSDVDVPSTPPSRKRKASDDEMEDFDDSERPWQRRRSNSSSSLPESPIRPTSGQISGSKPPHSSQRDLPEDLLPSSPPKQPSARQLRRDLLKLRRKHESTIEKYYNIGMTSSEPMSSIVYSLTSELGREDNDQLWLAIVGISSLEFSQFTQPQTDRDANGKKLVDRTEQIREILRDEVRRLNPVPEDETRNGKSKDIMPSRARSPTDYSIRLSPEPRFMLVRHWSLYDSMMHSPYLSTRLHIWSDAGKQRLHKLLAKMGVSLQEAGKSYVHMDMELKQSLRSRILKFAPQYNLDGLVPGDDGRRGFEGWGFVRSWGWKATLSASDAAIIVGAILEVGLDKTTLLDYKSAPQASYNARMQAPMTPPKSDDDQDAAAEATPDWTTNRFFAAYDALSPISNSSRQGPSLLMQHVSTAQHLARAVLRCGSALMAKKQIRHLRSFRLAVVKEGPDMPIFVHPGALVKLAAWVSDAVQVLEAERGRRNRSDDALVVGCLDEVRNVYVVVGIGGAGARKPVRSKAEIRLREEKKQKRQAEKAAKKLERARRKALEREQRRERHEANGDWDSDLDEAEDSDATESDGSDASDTDADESDAELAEARKRKGYGSNRFGQAFQEVVEETGARVRIDSFEHSVVEVKKEDLSGFLEALSSKSVVG